MAERIETMVPGNVWKVLVKPGDKVSAGDVLFILEVMKTEVPHTSEQGGTVKAVEVEAGDIAEDADELVFGDITGKRDRVEARAADRGIGEQGIHCEAAFAPALRDDGIFEDGNHETGITSVSNRDFFQGAGDDRRHCESAARAKRGAVEFFDGAADGDFFERRG